ncbi:MAG TPA: D-alanine--D-alanine ligase family protein [Terriglobia bacterium]|nr:D-alanine--D-alanine ligase family protein [Terriglobia bacterium]
MTKKIRLGVLFGGRSGEHEVSLTSAVAVMKALDPAKYELVPIGITREGRWRVGPRAFGLLTEAPGDDAAQRTAPLRSVLEEGRAVTPSVDPTGPKLLPLAKSPAALKARPEVDVIFPVLHGTFGEDGTIQGLLELADVPYVGAGVLASSTGMDKDVMKRLFRDAGLPVVSWELVLRKEWEDDPAGVRRRIEKRLRYPLFVKPANLGSSVGITKVHEPGELEAGMELAAQYDRKILVEKAVDAQEIECAVLGNDNPQASVPGEIVPVNEFYDYEAKYIKEGSELLIPARLSPRQTKRVQELAVRAFKAVDCAGMARVDFLLDRKSGKIFVMEINTIPGFTPISMYPKLWEASGVPYSMLLDRLIQLALERHRDKLRTRYDYTPLK